MNERQMLIRTYQTGDENSVIDLRERCNLIVSEEDNK
jgi:hypothetical protein